MVNRVDEEKIQHSLLKKQIEKAKRSFSDNSVQYLLSLVDQAYQDSDKERRLTEHTMQVMSDEVMEANHDLAAQAQELKQSHERYMLAAEAANDGLWDWDLKTDKVYFSSRWLDMLGLLHEDGFDTIDAWFNLIHPDYVDFVDEAIKNHVAGRSERIEVEYKIRHASGRYIWALARGLASRDEKGEVVRVAGSQTDITLRKQYEESLYKAAFHDELTGLANRALFIERLNQVIQKSKRPGEKASALLFLDLDRFKYINDSLGHEIGDEVLKVVAKTLKFATRGSDVVGRLGGDEFTVLLDPIDNIDEARHVAERVLRELNRPYEIAGKEIHIASSIGLTLIDDQLPDPNSILRNADLAMYEAKNRGKARLVIFDNSQHDKLLWRMQIETDLRYFVARKALEVYYQPLIDLKTGHIFAFEALLRWNHPRKGFISPEIFIPIAEEVGLIGQIGQTVLETVRDQVKEWKDQFGDENTPSIGVNMSVRQIMDQQYYDTIFETLTNMGDLKDYIHLEVTESVIMADSNLIKQRLQSLRDLGITLSIDDFGTGYFSLSYLHTFPLEILKIDREFISTMIEDSKVERLVATIIGLAQDLGLKTVAEGIETDEQMTLLQHLKCDYGQGYLFSRPMTKEDATKFLQSHAEFANVGKSLIGS